MVHIRDIIGPILEELIERQAALEAQISFDENAPFDTGLSRECDENQALLDSFTELQER